MWDRGESSCRNPPWCGNAHSPLTFSVSHTARDTRALENTMNMKLLVTAAVAAALSFPLAAQAQDGPAVGAATGAVTGAIVGAGVGAVAGGIPDDTWPRFRSYVEERHVPSYRYEHEVRVGEDLPPAGAT